MVATRVLEAKDSDRRVRKHRIQNIDVISTHEFMMKCGIEEKDDEHFEKWGEWLKKWHGKRLVVLDADISQLLDRVLYVESGDQEDFIFVLRLVHADKNYFFSSLSLMSMYCFEVLS